MLLVPISMPALPCCLPARVVVGCRRFMASLLGMSCSSCFLCWAEPWWRLPNGKAQPNIADKRDVTVLDDLEVLSYSFHFCGHFGGQNQVICLQCSGETMDLVVLCSQQAKDPPKAICFADVFLDSDLDIVCISFGLGHQDKGFWGLSSIYDTLTLRCFPWAAQEVAALCDRKSKNVRVLKICKPGTWISCWVDRD